MVLSAAIDSGYIFMSLVAILTSVISAVYYLAVVKEIFFEKSNYKLNKEFETSDKNVVFLESYKNKSVRPVNFKYDNIMLSGHLTITVSILTLILLLFIFAANESMSISNILALLIFNP